MRGIYTPSHKKLTVGWRVPGCSGYMFGYSGHRDPETPVPDRMSNSDPETPGYCPDTPDHNVRTLNRTVRINMDFHKKAVFSGRFDSHGFCRFSWAQLPHQHLWIKVPLDSTAFLYSISI
jgi:hypothetical protein